MYKASIVGIDNSGKTSVVRSFEGLDGFETIYLTDYSECCSQMAHASGALAGYLRDIAERKESKPLAGFAYLSHLLPYFFEQKSKKSPVLVSDRNPILDTLCYSSFYFPGDCSDFIRVPLKFLLERFFDYPDMFLHLEASPQTSLERRKGQLHENLESLTRLRELLDRELFEIERNGTRIVKIETDSLPLEEVKEIARYNINKFRQ